MPKIFIGEICRVLVYAAFAVIAVVTKFGLMLYFAFGFLIATSIPSILSGCGFKGMKPAMKAGNSPYEKLRGAPIANGIRGVLHPASAFAVYLNVKDAYRIGPKIETFLSAIGFRVIFFTVSVSQKPEKA